MLKDAQKGLKYTPLNSVQKLLDSISCLKTKAKWIQTFRASSVQHSHDMSIPLQASFLNGI